MKNLAKQVDKLKNLSKNEQYEYFKLEYPNLCDDIINYVLIRHLEAMQIYEEFAFIDLKKCSVETLQMTADQVFKIEYAQFCDWRDESKKYFDGWKNEIENVWINNGTWRGPILVTIVNNKFYAIDGNNRLRILRCYLKHSDKYKANWHTVYYIHN